MTLYSSLQIEYPEIANEWHPTKNGKLTPSDVSAHSGKKVWWLHSYDDPKTGKHFDFEWKSAIINRVRGSKCPYLVGKKVWVGFNDLETTDPLVCNEWDYEMNNDLLPRDVSRSSTVKAWWKCNKGHSWESRIIDKTKVDGCPICSKERNTSFPEYAIFYYIKKVDSKVIHSYKDLGFELDVYVPSKKIAIEYDGEYWHKNTRERDLTKDRLCKLNGIKLYRFREKKLGVLNSSSICIPVTNISFESKLRKLINEIYGIEIDINITRDESYINSLRDYSEKKNSLAIINPTLALQWHPSKNGTLTAEDVSCNSAKKVWWLLPYDDPKTGKQFDFEWVNAVYKRIRNPECPFISGKAVWQGYNDLATTDPELAKEWHPIKNLPLTPYSVSRGQRESVWWLIHYDDPNTGKHFEFEWEAQIRNRAKGNKCPYLSGQAVYKGFNDLTTTNPELAKEWHPIKNGDLTPDNVTNSSPKKVWWFLPFDDPKTGKHFEFEWISSVCNRSKGARCPYIYNKAVWTGYNDLATTNPKLASEWHPTKNGDLTPDQVMSHSGKKVWWLIHKKDLKTGQDTIYEWEATVNNRSRERE